MAIRTQGTAQTKKPTLKQKVAALTDFWAFVDMIGYQGGSERFAKCHKDLWDWYWTSVQAGDNKHLTLMPRGHLKSTIMSVGRCLWRIYQNPNIRIYVGTSKGDLSTAFVREIKSYLESDWLQENVWNVRPHISGNLIPVMDRLGRSRRQKFEEDGEYTEAQDKKVIWRANALQCVREYILKEPTVMVGSVGARATGLHFDEAQFDDIVTYDNISTPEKHERLMSWVYDIQSVIDPVYTDDWLVEKLTKVGVSDEQAKVIATTGGVFNVVGTRYDIEDYYNNLIENQHDLDYKIYQRNIYKNGEDPNEGYLWEEKWDEKLEKNTRTSMTSRRFASQYLNQIIDKESSLLKWDEVIYLGNDFFGKEEHQNVIWYQGQHDKIKKKIRLMMAVDPAASVSDRSDYTAIVVGGKDLQGNFYLVDAKMGRWKSHEISKAIFELCHKWTIASVHIEMVGGFKHFHEFMRTQFHTYKPISIVEYRPQGDKKTRVLNAIEPLINNGMLYVADKVIKDSRYRDQMHFFPRDNMHDDFPDVLAACIELAKKPLPPKGQSRTPTNTRWGGTR